MQTQNAQNEWLPQKCNDTQSVLYAVLDVSENERMPFYRDMGHSADVNKNIH